MKKIEDVVNGDVVSTFDLISNRKTENVVNAVLSKSVTRTSLEKLNLVYEYAVGKYNEIKKKKEDLTEEEKVDLMYLSKIVNRKVYNSLIEDMFQGINLEKATKQEVISIFIFV